MIAVKVLYLVSVVEAETGSAWLAKEASVTSVPAWFAQDLIAGLAWGLVVGLAFGAPRRPWPWRASRIALGLGSAALALLLTVSIYVYELFGVPPSRELWQALEGGGAARESIMAFVGPGAIAILLALAAVLIGGTLVLERVFASRRRLSMIVAANVLGLAGIGLLGGFVAPASQLALDRNALIEIAFSSAGIDDEMEPLPPPAEFARVLEPVAYDDRADPPPKLAYKLLRNWARKWRPNVVLVVLESTATGYMHVTGGKVENTPNLDAIAERSVRWTRHYAHEPRSMSSLYSIMCANFARPFKKPITYTRPRIDCRSISEVLHERGYRAGLFHSGTFAYTHKLYFFADRGYDVLLDGITLPGSGDEYQRWGWGLEEAGAVDALIDWVAQDPEAPFFATYIPVYPHHPYPLPEHLREPFKRFGGSGSSGKYVDAMGYVDSEVGRLMKALGELGLEDDTLFVFLGDHGEAFGEHPGSKAHGGKLYDEQVRTFVLWHAPGILRRSFRDDRALSHVDVVPTLLDLLEIPPQPVHVGRSAAAPGPRQMIPLYLPAGFKGLGLVDGDWKYIYDRKTQRSELYDLIADPDERSNVADLNAERVRTYQRRVLEFMSAQKAREASIPDIAPEQPPAPIPGATERHWTFNLASCEFDTSHFQIVNQGLQPSEKRRSETVVCERALGPIRGRITALSVLGHEQVTRANITVVLVWESPDGVRTPLVFAKLNGNDKKPATRFDAELRPEMTRFGPGGKLILEITFKYRGAASKFSPDVLRVDAVEVTAEAVER
jgi:arylsulfatase A-like enzyme